MRGKRLLCLPIPSLAPHSCSFLPSPSQSPFCFSASLYLALDSAYQRENVWYLSSCVAPRGLFWFETGSVSYSSVAVIKHCDQKQPGQGRVYLIMLQYGCRYKMMISGDKGRKELRWFCSSSLEIAQSFQKDALLPVVKPSSQHCYAQVCIMVMEYN